MPVIVDTAGCPAIGKVTIGRLAAERLQGRFVYGQASDLRLIQRLSVLDRQSEGLYAFALIADEAVRRIRLTDRARRPPKLAERKIGQRLPNPYALTDGFFYESAGAAHQAIDTTERSAAEATAIILGTIGAARDERTV
jgi:hypothetical protein